MTKFLAGLGIGVLAGVVLAPEKGSRTRQKLVHSAEDLVGRLQEQMPDLNKLASRARELMPDNIAAIADRARGVLPKAAGADRPDAGMEEPETEKHAEPLSQNEIAHMRDQVETQQPVGQEVGSAQAEHSLSMDGAADARIVDVLNNASKDELTSVKGIGPTLANRIIRHRPYDSAEKLVREGVLPESLVWKLKRDLVDRKRAA
jgi:DNA uptake protein ComE-like DNA-binding protein